MMLINKDELSPLPHGYIGKPHEELHHFGKQPKETKARLVDEYRKPEGALAPEGFL